MQQGIERLQMSRSGHLSRDCPAMSALGCSRPICDARAPGDAEELLAAAFCALPRMPFAVHQPPLRGLAVNRLCQSARRSRIRSPDPSALISRRAVNSGYSRVLNSRRWAEQQEGKTESSSLCSGQRFWPTLRFWCESLSPTNRTATWICPIHLLRTSISAVCESQQTLVDQ